MNIIEITVLQNEESKVEFTLWSDGTLNYKKDSLTSNEKARVRMTGIDYESYNDIANFTLSQMRKHSKTTCEVY